MDTAGHIRRPRAQRLEDIQLAAAVRVAPAGTTAVLLRPWDKRVEQPDGRLISGSCARHSEFEQEDLVCAAKTVISWDARPEISTAPSSGRVSATGLASHEDDFVVVEEDVLESLRGGGGGSAGGGGVGEGGAEVGGPDAGGAGAGTAAHIVEEDDVVGCAGGGGVVGLLGPGCAGSCWGDAGAGCAGGGAEGGGGGGNGGRGGLFDRRCACEESRRFATGCKSG